MICYTTLNRTVAPLVNPITRDEARQHLRMDSDFVADDALLDRRIASATGWLEKVLGRALCEQTWAMVLGGFPGEDPIELPKAPLISVESITYLDTSGASQTLDPATYYVVKDESSASVLRAYAQVWPATLPQSNAVTVTFKCGYPKAGTNPDWDYRVNVPAPIKEAAELLVQGAYDNLAPEDSAALNDAVWNKIGVFRVWRF